MRPTASLALWSAILSIVTIPLAAQAPSSLTVKAATGKRVDVSWNGVASGYTVLRRVLGGSFASIGTTSTTTFSDTTIDTYTAYQYQVLANLTTGASSPSNQVTVGPPPSGFTTAAPAPGPADSYINDNFAYDLTMCLDSN